MYNQENHVFGRLKIMRAMPDFPYDIFPDPDNLPTLPEELLKDGQNYLDRLRLRASPEDMAVFESRSDLLYVLSMSDFVAKVLIQYPKECADLIRQGALDSETFCLDFSDKIKERIVPGLTDPELKKRLRILRRTSVMPVAWRDLTGRCDIEEVFVSLSNLAEDIVINTVSVVRKNMMQGFGNALCEDGREMPLLILGMGKLGGGELNFSSDLDLICCYPYEGNTVGGTRSVSHQEYFTKTVQRVSNLLSEITADSFCYRVDLRLRPFGDAGPLVSSFDALSVYYERQGRTWERYALVKAKLLGSFRYWQPYGYEMIELLRPFVYRRYLDYGAIESLRKLKHTIEAEVRRRNLGDNFKLGSGGIREIEFVAQVFELMRGGRSPELVERSLRKTLSNISKLQLLPDEVCKRLDVCYVYLRRLENITQELADRQTQSLPENPKDRMRIALSMNRKSFDDLRAELDAVREEVHREFISVMSDDSSSDGNPKHNDSAELWESDLTVEERGEILQPLMRNKEDKNAASDLARSITQLLQTLSRMPVGPIGRDTLTRLMPKLIEEVATGYDNAAKLFNKVALLLERVALRTTYLQLLTENSGTRNKLLSLLNDNEFAGSLISAHPILLDELIAPRYFTTPPKPDEFLSMLHEKLLRIDPDDLEEQMEELRLFKKIMILRISMSDQSQSMPLMKISDSLSWLAEAILRELAVLAWHYTEQKFGAPPDRTADDPGFAVIAYGKLGGIELGYKSDLDMVFIRENSEASTTGEHSVPVSMFYQRFVQRFMHLCTTRMSGGVLYDLDMRLRPDGDSGLLMTNLEAYEAYQKKRAWTWEHQALVRARPIAGSAKVMREFDRIRDEVLRTPKDEDRLMDDVYAMRVKMRNYLDRSSDTLFDLKQGRGGMVDIEFIAQYLLLREAPKHPDMVLWSDNVRIFDECARLGCLSQEDTDSLKNAYLAIRECYHRVSLANQPRIVGLADRPVQCDVVAVIFDSIFAPAASRFVAGAADKNPLPASSLQQGNGRRDM